MNPTIECFKTIVKSGLLSESLTDIPESGASSDQITKVETAVGRSLSLEHIETLNYWDGADLDIVIFLSASDKDYSIISAFSYAEFPPEAELPVPFASDHSGFVYAESKDGKIWQWDHEGAPAKVIALNIQDFFCNLVFGERSHEFSGQEWREELIAAGVIKN